MTEKEKRKKKTTQDFSNMVFKRPKNRNMYHKNYQLPKWIL